MKVLYFGSDALSFRVLTRLYNEGLGKTISQLQVISPPDRLAGKRHRALTPCVLKAGALQLGLSVQDAPVKAPRAPVADWAPIIDLQQNKFKADLAVVFSFGYFLPQSVLETFPLGAINIHPSLLPKYRGPAPIQHALLNGDQETGVSIIDVDPKAFDAGKILIQQTYSLVDRSKTFLTISNDLANIGTNLVLRILHDLPKYRAEAVEQKGLVTRAPKLKLNDYFITDWTSTAHAVNKYRALESLKSNLRPNGQSVTLEQVSVATIPTGISANVGDAFLNSKNELAIRFADGWLQAGVLRLEGKASMKPQEFYNGFLLRKPRTSQGVISHCFF